VALVRAQVPSNPVPDVRKDTLEVATQKLRALGLEVIPKPELDDNVAKGNVIRQIPEPSVKLKEGKSVTLIVSDGPLPVDIPDLTDMTKADALAALQKAALKPGDVTADTSETVEADHVISWTPTGPAHHGDTVSIVVSQGPPKRTLPDLTKMTYDQAVKALQDLGLSPVRDDRNDDDVAAGAIIGTRPAVGNKVEKGAPVTIVVSKGQVAVPNIYGMNTAQAKAALEAVGFKLGNVFGISGIVFRSTPEPGAKAKAGTAVSVYII
jgi:serine/threonine-protein kinase